MEQPKNQERLLTSLLDIMHVACKSTSLEDILVAVSQKVVDAIGATACNSFLFPDRAERGNYFIVGADGMDSSWRAPDPPDQLALDCMRTMEPITVDDTSTETRCDHISRDMFGIKSGMVFPLVFQGKCLAVGCTWYDHIHHITPEEVEAVMSIAEAAAVAVANAELHQENLRLAIAEERNRLAQELHDSVCQSLATTKLRLNVLLRGEELSPSAQASIKEAISLIETGYADARDIIHSIRVAGVVGPEFHKVMNDYLVDFAARNSINIKAQVAPEHGDVLNADAMLQMARIVGEALSNVRKHAHAKNVSLLSSIDDGVFTLVITDDGIGFDIDNDRESRVGHFGLSIMRERAQLAGGTLAIERARPHGTRITLTIPYL